MAKLIVEKFKGTHEIVTTFANTGDEQEETLKFVDLCDREFNLNVVWLEAVTHFEERKGCTHKVVDFDSASRSGEPFVDVVKKYGIPNSGYFHCTRELKLNPMRSYLRSIGWSKNYTTCIGIRADEIDRQSSKREEKCFWYPLIQAKALRSDIDELWNNRGFRLAIPQFRGNCKTCHKKSFRKLVTIARQNPDDFETFRKLEQTCKFAASGQRKLYRTGKTVDDVFQMAQDDAIETFTEETFVDPFLDLNGGCSESCEVFTDEDD